MMGRRECKGWRKQPGIEEGIEREEETGKKRKEWRRAKARTTD